MLFSASAILILRRLRKIDANLIVMVSSLISLIQISIAVLILGVFQLPKFDDIYNWGLILGLGFASFWSQIAMTLALKVFLMSLIIFKETDF
jgi:hypothetical protein